MTIGERIKKLRLEHNMTQEELGEKIGAIKQTVHKYENGTITNIPTEKIETIAKVFGVSASYIMGWDDTEPETIAAHKNNPDEDWTQEELDEIEAFKEFVRMKRKSRK